MERDRRAAHRIERPTMTVKFRLTLVALIAAASAAVACAQAPEPTCPPTPQQPTSEQIQAGMRAARDHGFLWRITKDGHDSWLFGTLHVGKFDWAFPGPRVLAALKRSDTIALEIDELDPQMQARMTRTMAAQTRTPLPAAMQLRLDKVAQAECVPPEALAALAPEMQIAALTTLIGRRDGLDPGYGADLYLAGWGHGSKRSVVSLETPELQLKLLQADTPAETIEFVDTSLADMEDGKARPTLLHVAQVWADGNWAALSAYESWCDCLKTASDRADMARMLDERNPGMADGIAALHASGQKVFAAVGSLHMIGPQGLPALMAQRGYRVEQILYDKPRETTP
jgi:uncharacterized protein YbaP (TraB family)